MTRVIAVASAKGGVGKTTTTATLGATLATAGARVAVVDADLGMANLGSAFDIDVDGATVHDVLSGTADSEAATYEGPSGLAVVPGNTDLTAFPEADPANFRKLIDQFSDYDYVLLDTGAGLSHDTVLPLSLADDVLLVTDTDPNAVGDTEKTRQVADRLGGTISGVVLTRVDPETAASGDRPDVATDIDAPVLGTIPTSSVVADAVRARKPVSEFAPTSDIAAAYRALARELTGEEIPDPEPTARDESPSPPESAVASADATEETENASGDAVDAADVDDAAEAEGTDLENDVVEDVHSQEPDATVTEIDSEDESTADVDAEGTTDTEVTEAEDTTDADADAADATGVESAEVDADAEASDATTDERDGDVSVPDAEGGVSPETVDSDADADGESDATGSPLVEEAEADDEAENGADDEAEDGEDDSRSGFLSRLFG